MEVQRSNDADAPSRDVASARRVGVREVARAAGVSTQTVSRVINENPGIRSETRQRVLEAMAALDYRVNNAARALGTSRTRTLGIVASDASMYGPAVGILAIESAARAAGRWVTTAYADAGDAASVVAAASHLAAQGVDGVVVVAPHVRSLAAVETAGLGVPVIALHGPEVASVQRETARIAVVHLADAGHRRIGHLAGPEDWLEAAERAEGFDAAMNRLGLQSAGQWRGDWSAESGFRAAESIAAAVHEGNGPTAIFAANDQMALGLIAGLAATGLAVPGDVSVVGVDDNPDAAFYRPALSTVRLDVEGEAARCVAVLVGEAGPVTAALVAGDVASPATAPPRLVVRESSAPPV